jgi:hypothetical protein
MMTDVSWMNSGVGGPTAIRTGVTNRVAMWSNTTVKREKRFWEIYRLRCRLRTSEDRGVLRDETFDQGKSFKAF